VISESLAAFSFTLLATTLRARRDSGSQGWSWTAIGLSRVPCPSAACLKRGINAELRRKRLERCCELLHSTDISIPDLAPMIGFRSGDYLRASFKQAYGVTPRKYRLGERKA